MGGGGGNYLDTLIVWSYTIFPPIANSKRKKKKKNKTTEKYFCDITNMWQKF